VSDLNPDQVCRRVRWHFECSLDRKNISHFRYKPIPLLVLRHVNHDSVSNSVPEHIFLWLRRVRLGFHRAEESSEVSECFSGVAIFEWRGNTYGALQVRLLQRLKRAECVADVAELRVAGVDCVLVLYRAYIQVDRS